MSGKRVLSFLWTSHLSGKRASGVPDIPAETVLRDDHKKASGEREFYRNRQWAVTADGLTGPNDYRIEPNRLHKGLDSGRLGWVEHLAEKGWVDLDAFIEAYLIACVVFGVKSEYIGKQVCRGRNKRTRSGLE